MIAHSELVHDLISRYTPSQFLVTEYDASPSTSIDQRGGLNNESDSTTRHLTIQ